ncbi:MAG: transposase family protein, partial [Leptospiraceae bacterium]|nr:transposase family protein [Leptospiraceae bacterium]
LERLGLRRIWGYHVVDVYSKAFDVIFFADNGLGENADDLLTAMIYFMNRKQNRENPLCGLPLNIYSDPGSGFRSKAFANFNYYFGINHLTHEAGRANSTGAVESRIRYNQRFERKFGFMIRNFMEHEDRFEAFKEFMETEVVKYNFEKGFYSKWESGLTMEPVLPQRQDFVYARTEPEIASVDGFGEVVLDKNKYYVSPDLKGQKVLLKRRFCNFPVAVDANKIEYICQNERAVVLGEGYYGNKKTDWERNREEVKTLAGQIKRGFALSPITENNISAEDVFFSLCEDMAIGASEIPEDMQREALLFFESRLREEGQVSKEDRDSIQKIFHMYLDRSDRYETARS